MLLVSPKDRSPDFPIADATALIRPERAQLERRLFEMERIHDGRSVTYAGICLYCPAGTGRGLDLNGENGE